MANVSCQVDGGHTAAPEFPFDRIAIGDEHTQTVERFDQETRQKRGFENRNMQSQGALGQRRAREAAEETDSTGSDGRSRDTPRYRSA